MRKLWPLHLEGLSPENLIAKESFSVKAALLTTAPNSVMKRGPGLEPRRAKYFSIICTGQKTTWRLITIESGRWL